MIKASGLVLALAMAGGAAYAADQPVYGPPPSWVKPASIPAEARSTGAAADLVLWSMQSRLRPNDDETFVEQAIRINSSEGLAKAGNIIQVWTPDTQTLAIHRARILRGGKVIDLLAGGHKFTVLRRETNLEAASIDGALTATLQPEGLQVGDVLDVAYTLTTNEPALAGHSEDGVVEGHAGTVGRLSVRLLWPSDRAFHTWKTDDLPSLQSTTQGGWVETGFEQTDAVSPEPPKGAPLADQLFGILQVSDFKDWADLSSTEFPLYDRATTLAPGSPLKAEIARLRAANADPKARALAALELVESQTRYLFVGLNAGGYTPAPADLTWTRRFGDCKGKTVLLLALLRGLDVQAEPALVNTVAGDGLDRRLPELGAFDHVLIRAVIAGKVYWLDATRMGDQDLDALQVPNFRWALPLRASGATLEPLTPQDPALPIVETILKVDVRAGVDKPAPVHEEVILRGDAGWAFGLAMKQASRIDADRALRQALTADRSWITPDSVAFAYDPKTTEARATLDGHGAPPFTSPDGASGGGRDWLIAGSYVGYDADFARTSDYHRNAPYAVGYPASTRTLVDVQLPGDGKAFEALNGESVSRTIAGMDYSRSAAVAAGRFSMVASARATARSFPASEAAPAEVGLRSLSEYPVSLRYAPAEAEGTGPAPQPGAAVTPQTPEDKAMSELVHKDYAAAEADFSTALEAAPSASLYYRRGVARAARGEAALAQADLQKALKLDPKNAFAAFGLGRLALQRGDLTGAKSYFATAQANSAKTTNMAAMISGAYEQAGRYAEAYPYWDVLAASLSDTKARAHALNAGCWLRAEAGVDLAQALQKCDASIAMDSNAYEVLDSRGLVELRLGTLNKAVDDYTSALARRPDLSSSLYGRAIAEARLGQTKKAEADRQAAKVADPKIEAMFARWGLSR